MIALQLICTLPSSSQYDPVQVYVKPGLMTLPRSMHSYCILATLGSSESGLRADQKGMLKLRPRGCIVLNSVVVRELGTILEELYVIYDGDNSSGPVTDVF